MQYQLKDGVIETGIGSYGKPPNDRTRQHAGVATWLLINGEWKQWNKRGCHYELTEASCLTIEEFCEYYKKFLN